MEKGLIWNLFSKYEQDEYVNFLKIFGSISYLFKKKDFGTSSLKPYLYYRNHEQLFGRAFNSLTEDITRSDSAFDFILGSNNERFGIGIKTWLHTKNDKSFQKVAEFDKVSKDELNHINDNTQLIRKIIELRNKRINADISIHNLGQNNVYHCVTRSENQMNIFETPYELISEDAIENVKMQKTLSWRDSAHLRNYRYNFSKSTLEEQFLTPLDEAVKIVPIEIYDDPFELLSQIKPGSTPVLKKPVLYLSLYSIAKDAEGNPKPVVHRKSGINKWHRHPNERNRMWDVELRIPRWIHESYPGWFFNHDFLSQGKKEDSTAIIHNGSCKTSVEFTLKFPDGKEARASVNGQNGKNIQTKNSKDLGKWLLKEVFGMTDSEMSSESDKIITFQKLRELNIGAIQLTMLDQKNKLIGIDVTSAQIFENFAKENNRVAMNLMNGKEFNNNNKNADRYEKKGSIQ